MKNNKLFTAAIVLAALKCVFNTYIVISNGLNSGFDFATVRSIAIAVISAALLIFAFKTGKKRNYTIYFGFILLKNMIFSIMDLVSDSDNIMKNALSLVSGAGETIALALIVCALFANYEAGICAPKEMRKQKYFKLSACASILSCLFMSFGQYELIDSGIFDLFEGLMTIIFSAFGIKLFFILATFLASKKLYIVNYIILIVISLVSTASSSIFLEPEVIGNSVMAHALNILSVFIEMFMILAMFKATEEKCAEITEETTECIDQ